MKVLIADDDVDTLRLVKSCIKKWGHDVIAVSDGAQALSVLKSKNAPSLAILDWNMPKVDGLEVIRRLRSEDADNHVYTILLTARTEKQDLLLGLNSGADDYIRKPFDREELIARLRAGQRTVQLEQELIKQNKLLSSVNGELEIANERLQKDFEIAATFQQSLLPKNLPKIPDLSIDWLYKPCDELAGDMLNIFWLDKQHLGLYLLDVSGHGVASSFLTGTVSRLLTPIGGQSSLVRTKGNGAIGNRLVSPADVITQLNEQFYFDQEIGHYFTIIYAVFDTVSHLFRFATAGHPGPIVVGAEKAPSVVEMNSFPIGFNKEANYKNKDMSINKGERLYLYSDGITEVANKQNELWGANRLGEALSRGLGSSIKESLQYAVKLAEQWSEGKIDDDISLLAVEVHG